MPKFKVGDRVELNGPSYHKKLKLGAKGTILEESRFPYIQWDDFTHGHDNGDPSVPGSSWAVDESDLKRIKKPTTPKTKETKTMNTKKPGTSHGKLTTKGMKEALKPEAKTTEVPYRPTVGDVVRIVKDTCFHGFAIGTVFTIRKDDKSDTGEGDKGGIPYYPGARNNPDHHGFRPIDCELVTKAADAAKATPKSKYPVPRVQRELIAEAKPLEKRTKAELIATAEDLVTQFHNLAADHCIAGTKLDRAIVDLKEAKAKIKELSEALGATK